MKALPMLVRVPVPVLVLVLVLVLLIAPGAARAATENGVVTCLLKPHQVVQLGSPTAGLIVEETVDRGDTVTEGQVVASLEAGVETATVALDRLKASSTAAVRQQGEELAFAQRALTRRESLAASQILNQNALDELQTRARQAEIKLREAELEQRIATLTAARSEAQLANRRIRSPIDGVVTERKLSPGEYVYEQTPVMTIAQVDPLNVELVVSADRYGSVRVGDVATVTPAPPSGGQLPARVAVVDPVIDAASNTFGVRLLLPNPGRRVPAGIRCAVAWTPFPAPTPRNTP